jgi:hypothetical protein
MKDGAQTEAKQIHAGWQCPGRFPGEPPRVDGWSIVLDNIESKSLRETHGRMIFPERASFEFEGSVDKMVRELKKAEGGRAIFAIKGFTFWRH